MRDALLIYQSLVEYEEAHKFRVGSRANVHRFFSYFQ